MVHAIQNGSRLGKTIFTEIANTMSDTEETSNIRFIMHKGVKYLRAEDVAKFIAEAASGEETDVRNRFNEAAFSLIGSKKKGKK